MIKSMTGFGRSEYSDGKRNVTAEIRSVNHRYCDITVKMSRRYSFAEEKLKALVKAGAQRGKMELSINVENLTESDNLVQLNLPAARQYYENLTLLKEEFGMKDEINLRMLATMPDVMKSVSNVDDEEEIYKALAAAVQGAVDKLNEMRAVEGQKLAEDILMRGGLIRSKVQEIEERAPLVAQVYTEKLRTRIQDLLGDAAAGISEERILLEAAVFADKSNITEELVRLDSHIIQLNDIISKSSGTDGKKLDFLVQEMNREANTIGSKANDLEITNAVLFLKSEIEKIREQVQNIE